MNHVKLASYDNSWYRPGNKMKILLWYILSLLFFKNSLPFPQIIKKGILQVFKCKIGSNVLIKPNVTIKYPWLLEIQNDVWIGEHVWIDNLAKVTIASNVCVSQGAMLLTGNHDYKKSTFDLLLGHIVLEEGVWLGAKSVVCPGVTCKNHSILSVGSVATQDLDPFGIYQGNPAVRIRDRKLY